MTVPVNYMTILLRNLTEEDNGLGCLSQYAILVRLGPTRWVVLQYYCVDTFLSPRSV